MQAPEPGAFDVYREFAGALTDGVQEGVARAALRYFVRAYAAARKAQSQLAHKRMVEERRCFERCSPAPSRGATPARRLYEEKRVR